MPTQKGEEEDTKIRENRTRKEKEHKNHQEECEACSTRAEEKGAEGKKGGSSSREKEDEESAKDIDLAKKVRSKSGKEVQRGENGTGIRREREENEGQGPRRSRQWQSESDLRGARTRVIKCQGTEMSE